MKRFTRLFTMLVLLAMLAVPTVSTFAQDGANPLCQGLSQEDCDLLTAPTMTMAGVTSFTTPNWAVSFTLTVPEDVGMMEGEATAEPATQTVTFNAQGSTGGFAMTPDAEILMHLIIDEASGTDGEETMSLSGAEVVITREMAFVKYNDQWYGDTLENAEIDPDDFSVIEDLSGGLDLADIGVDLTGVVTTTRGADAEVMGQQVATFVTEMNVAQLLVAVLSSPMLGELLGEEMGGEAMSPEDVQMIGMFLQPMLAGTTVSVEQWVGLDDNYLHKLALDVTLALDLSLFAPEVGKIDGELHFVTELADFNAPLTAPVPDEYLPLEQLEEDAGFDLGELEQELGGLGM